MRNYRRQKIENFIKSQQGALDKFVVKESQISLDNENIDVKLDENFDSVNNVVSNDDDHFIVDHSDTDDNDDIDSTHSLGGKECIKNLNDDRQNEEHSNSHFDPRYWNALDSKMIDTLAVKGPKRDILFQKNLKINLIDDWLVYSKELDRIFFFCCKIFKKGCVKGGLVNEGYEDWSHIGTRLQEHEVGMEHKNIRLLDLIEMLAEFDPIIQEHVQRISSDDIHFHYLGHNIQNELISLIASSIKYEIMKKVRQAKYFSISHQEQISMILRYVDLSSSSIVIDKLFLGFINVNDTTGQGLFDVLLQELKLLHLDVDNVRGQGYDNDINPRAFYTPCGSHSLNLMLCDMANTCSKVRDFFGVILQIYTIFANSTKRRQILKDNVKGLILISLSSTRWESRVDSVKAIRFQIGELLKSYLRSSMSQERLNGLTLIAIENDQLEKAEYEDLIQDFVSKNTRRLLLFK
uniref:DUF4371 domain-containing protein n=1 Tax=Kalanchoe fedtschenkoi TaxID=63787 RepID=A0A7N0RDT9_KALFE